MILCLVIECWLDVERGLQNDMFYKQYKISAEGYILNQLNPLPEFISSPEIGFLKGIGPKLGRAKTRLIFTFLEGNAIEPTTKTPYSSLAKDLGMIKSFASGILVPKEYVWPMNEARILQPATTLVQDAHKLGLSVFVSGFANDKYLSYNYSYDPAREYLQFVDNSQFAVDGVLSDFPSTASEAIGETTYIFSHFLLSLIFCESNSYKFLSSSFIYSQIYILFPIAAGCLNQDKNATREVKGTKLNRTTCLVIFLDQ